jgi:DNA-binding LytR/AlgR family response regulator
MDKPVNCQFDPTCLQNTLYIRRDRGHSIIMLKNGERNVIKASLSLLEKIFPSDQFYRIHRCYLVNINAITEFRHFRDQYLAIIQDHRIPVSRRIRKKIIDNLDTL